LTLQNLFDPCGNSEQILFGERLQYLRIQKAQNIFKHYEIPYQIQNNRHPFRTILLKVSTIERQTIILQRESMQQSSQNQQAKDE
jgi:hypothetical protein